MHFRCQGDKTLISWINGRRVGSIYSGSKAIGWGRLRVPHTQTLMTVLDPHLIRWLEHIHSYIYSCGASPQRGEPIHPSRLVTSFCHHGSLISEAKFAAPQTRTPKCDLSTNPEALALTSSPQTTHKQLSVKSCVTFELLTLRRNLPENLSQHYPSSPVSAKLWWNFK